MKKTLQIIIICFCFTGLMTGVHAANLHKHFYVSGGTSYFLGADEHTGGFSITPGDENPNQLETTLEWNFAIGYGLKPIKKTLLALELDISVLETNVNPEAVYWDPDASTLIQVPTELNPGPNDEWDQIGIIQLIRTGQLRVTPVIGYALFHFGQRRSSAYAGAGVGYAMIDWQTDPSYVYWSGYNDGQVDDSLVLGLKGGIEVPMSQHWHFYVNGEYRMFKEQFSYEGVDRTFDIANWTLHPDFDPRNDPYPEIFGFPSDYRLIAPGNIRLDGFSGGIGVRYVFSTIEQMKENRKNKKEEKEKEKKGEEEGEEGEGKEEGEGEGKEEEEKGSKLIKISSEKNKKYKGLWIRPE
jgi:hypothetical protein